MEHYYDARFALTDAELKQASEGEAPEALKRHSQHLEALAKLRAAYGPEELRDALLLDNAEIGSDGRLRGFVAIFSPSAPIRKPEALFGARWFGQVAIARVGDLPEPADLAARMRELAEHLKVVADRPYTLAQHMHADGVDARPWTAALNGGHGHFVGLMKEERERAEPTHYLVAHAGSGRAGEELLEHVKAMVESSRGEYTFADLLASSEYAAARHSARRNVLRLIAEAAAALGVDVDLEEDAVARTADRSPAPTMARQDGAIVTEYNALARVVASGYESIAYYSHAAHLGSCRGAVAHLVDPTYGAIVYAGPARGGDGRGPFCNRCADAFPIGSGRHATPEELEAARAALSSDAKRLAHADRVVLWRGKQKGSAARQARLYRYADLAERRLEVHRAALGAAHGSTRLKPVFVVVPPPESN